jgi:aspartate aminotransferase
VFIAMKLAKRVTSIQPSPTLAVNAKAGAMRAKGVDIVNFGVGQPDFDTPEHVCQAAIEAIQQGFTRYTPADGMPELKQAVVDKFLRDNGLTYSPDQVIVNVGGKHSGYLLMQALVNPGDEVIVPAPYWVSYPPMVILAGGEPVIIQTKQENDFKLTVQELEQAITPKTKAIFMNSPSNPTGAAYTAEELAPLAEACAEAGIIICSDEIYESILFDGRKFTATASISPKVFEHTVSMNGASKAYAMTGWRIGYMAGPQDLIKATAKIQSQSTSNTCSIAQKAALAALNGPQDEVVRRCGEFQKRRDYIMERLLAIPGITCPRPAGAFYAFPNVAAYYGKKAAGKPITNSVEMADYLLEVAHIATVPGAAFGEEKCVRFSFATSMQVIEEGMNRFQKALADLQS